jgi:hypothetical protein
MVKLENIPSHNTEGKYATLVETSFELNQSWYVFIKMDGNEKLIYQLSHLINQIDWKKKSDNYLNQFSFDVDNLVSAKTAKELTMLGLNHIYKHTKFDGKLRKIPLEFNNFDSNNTMMCKINDLLKNLNISKFVDDMDVSTDYADTEDDSSFVPSTSGDFDTEEDVDVKSTENSGSESESRDGSGIGSETKSEDCSSTEEDD